MGRWSIFSDQRTIVYLRELGEADKASCAKPERFLMVMNNADQARTISIPVMDTSLVSGKRLIDVMNEKTAITVTPQKTDVQVSGRSVNIYRVE